MHYYKRNIGDYHKKAGRLTMLQHGAYTLLMDACYDREKFPTREEAIEWLWANSQDEVSAIDFVLGKFFTNIDGVFVQLRIESELSIYAKNAETNKRIALEREEKRRLKSTNRAPLVDDSATNRHLTTNQEPLTTNQEKDNKDTCDKSRINNQAVVDVFHECLPMLPKVQVLNDSRKTAIKNFFKKRVREKGEDFTIDNFKAYLGYIASNCKWMLQANPKAGGGFYKPRDFDYILTDRCYIAVKENRFDDMGNN